MRPKYNPIIVAPHKKVANVHLLNYWKPYIKIISSPLLCVFLEPLARSRLTSYPVFRFAFSADATHFPEIQRRYFGQPALLALKEFDSHRGWACLQDLGMPEGAWFVCVHCREDGYLGNVNQSVRNADIHNYLLAIETIVKRGGWVVRVGDPTMKALPPMEHVIDYAHLSIKSEWMDVFLCASCKFFLGSNSGLCNVANIFGVPVAIANLVYLAGVLQYGPEDISIPKLIWSNKEGRYLSFEELLGYPTLNFHFDYSFTQAGLQPIENTPEDIRDLAMEMFDNVEGKLSYTIEDELLQKRFKSLMNPSHFSYGAISRVGRSFLRKYAFLLNS
ncbi:TIGR04372 family glycosyltransferase [Candidatus Pacearchaeota archaeon]|nr:TIGR04372 family glycosyltransferase [Candidatus Pacearchaeota archaeon]